jgi:hypothetical protein
MPGQLTFTGAVALWNDARLSLDEDKWESLSTAEVVILDHNPASALEAVRIVEVLLDQGGDPRTDGKDRSALGRLRDFLFAQTRIEA